MVVPRLDISTSNSVEVQFNAIAELRYTPTLDMLLSLETYICENIYKKSAKSETLENSLLPRILQKLNKEVEQSVYYIVRRTGENTAVIVGNVLCGS